MLDEIKSLMPSANLSLAFVGSLLANSFLNPSTKKVAWTNIIIGTSFAAITAPAISDILQWKMPGFPATDAVVGAAAFLLGLFAMIIIPSGMRLIKAHKVNNDA